MEFLRLSIRSTPAQIGIESPRGKLDIKSPPGELEITSPRVDMQIRQPRGELNIDGSAAYSAYAMGGVFETSNRIYSQMKQRIMENIAKIAQEGNRMANIANSSNAVAEIASQAMNSKENLHPEGPAGLFNVKINYTAHPAEIDTTPMHPNIEYHVNKPEINYTPSRAQIYVRQMNSIQMWVSEYDIHA